MRKLSCVIVFSLFFISVRGQNVGLSFSYFIPRNGSFSTPISPFSLRGVGVSLNKYVALQTGFSLYRMSGLNLRDVPFETTDPLVGPNFTMFVPGEVVIQFKGRRLEWDLKGGGFAFYGFDQKINYGNLDRAIRKAKDWDVVNSEFTLKNHPGFGLMVGTELTFKVTRQWGLSAEVNYLNGLSKLPLSGRYVGGKLNGTNSEVVAEYKDAKVDFTGLEFSLGIIFSTK